MLWFRVAANDLNRRGTTHVVCQDWAVRVNRLYQYWIPWIWLIAVAVAVSSLAPNASAQSKGHKGKPPK
ncbi:MAG TPA: hypothetical protein VN825_05340, partial [Candidatus Acidoferrum sp.]|nr:hypothetical protein [Candidatus Acidoferrum sp.]